MYNNTYRLCADGLDGPVILRIAPAVRQSRVFPSDSRRPCRARSRAAFRNALLSMWPGAIRRTSDPQLRPSRHRAPPARERAPCSWIRTDTSATHPPQPLPLVSPNDHHSLNSLNSQPGKERSVKIA